MRSMHAVVLLFILLFVAGRSSAGESVPPPQAVSPGTSSGHSTIAAECPGFNWAGPGAAEGYEIALFEIEESGGDEPQHVELWRTSLPGTASGFTPDLSRWPTAR